jgi:hypothetical protein
VDPSITPVETTLLELKLLSITKLKPSILFSDYNSNKMITPGNSWLTVVECPELFSNGNYIDAAKLALTPQLILVIFQAVKSLHSHGVTDSKSNIDLIDEKNFDILK